jgi:hypothetical protein
MRYSYSHYPQPYKSSIPTIMGIRLQPRSAKSLSVLARGLCFRLTHASLRAGACFPFASVLSMLPRDLCYKLNQVLKHDRSQVWPTQQAAHPFPGCGCHFNVYWKSNVIISSIIQQTSLVVLEDWRTAWHDSAVRSEICKRVRRGRLYRIGNYQIRAWL